HVFRVYFKNAILRQYEKFSMFLRNELCSNNLYDFGLKKGLDHLDEVRQKFQTIIGSFAAFQAQWLNVHVDFPLLQRIALPTTLGSVRPQPPPLRSAKTSRGTDCSSATVAATPTASPRRVFRSHCCFCSSISAYVDRWPTAASTIIPIRSIDPKAASKSRTT